jgi:hypothetical protein
MFIIITHEHVKKEKDINCLFVFFIYFSKITKLLTHVCLLYFVVFNFGIKFFENHVGLSRGISTIRFV